MPRRKSTINGRNKLLFGGLSPLGKSILNSLLVLGACLLVGNAIIGENGLVDSLEAERQHQWLLNSVDVLRRENQILRIEADRLRSDPMAIEELARRELGFIEPGELVFTVVQK